MAALAATAQTNGDITTRVNTQSKVTVKAPAGLTGRNNSDSKREAASGSKKVKPPKRRARARTRRKAKKTAVTRSDHPSAATQHNSPFRLAVSDIAYRHSATIQEHQEKQLLSRGLEPLL